MELWEKIRRFLLLWTTIFLLLLIAAVVVHWERIAAVLAGSAMGFVKVLIILAVTAALVIRLIRVR